MRHGPRLRKGVTALGGPAVRRVVVPGIVALAAWWWWTDAAGAATAETDSEDVPSSLAGLNAVDSDFADMVGDLEGTMASLQADLHRTETFVAEVRAQVSAFDSSLDADTARLDQEIDRQVTEMVAAALDRPIAVAAPAIVETVVETPLVDVVLDMTTHVAVAVAAVDESEIARPAAASVPAPRHADAAIVSSHGSDGAAGGPALRREGHASTAGAIPLSTSRAQERVERAGPQLAALLGGFAALMAGLILAASTAVVTLCDGLGARPPTTPD